MKLDLFFQKVSREPHALFSRLRAEGPVVPIEDGRLFAVARHEQVQRVMKNHADFSSAGMNQAISELLGIKPERTNESLITLDPPDHSRLRGLVAHAFTPREISRLEPRVRQIARELLDGLRGRERFDLVEDFSTPLPIRVIAELLGVAPERQADFKRWSDALVVNNTRRSQELERRVNAARNALDAYFAEVIAERRSAPRDDLVSKLIQAESGPERLTPREVVDMGVLLLVAGNITTTYLVASAMNALLRHPRQLALLRERPELIPQAVEEALRFEGPAVALFRRTTHEVELGGQRLPAGKLVCALIGSANRDERMFAEPNRFDITRESKHHIAFGHGVHFCLGAPLARLETRIALELLLERFPGLVIDGDVQYLESLFLRGPRSLPLRVVERWPQSAEGAGSPIPGLF